MVIDCHPIGSIGGSQMIRRRSLVFTLAIIVGIPVCVYAGILVWYLLEYYR